MQNNSSPQISSISRGPRQSNFELLRIIAMFMVLGLHANYLALGEPSKASFAMAPLHEFTRIALEAMCICAVNVFVMISGWFGIKPSLKGFCSFIFQVLYCFTLSFAIMFAAGLIHFTPEALLKIFLLRNSGWFIVSYSIMYVLSPVLNTFLDNAPKRTITMVLLSFFAIEMYWGFIDRRPDFAHGYSALSFCGLYLLAGSIKRYYTAICKYGGIICTVSITLLAILLTIQLVWSLPFNWLDYDSPLVISSAVGLIMLFSRIKIKSNRLINFVAASAFAAYLLHSNFFMFNTAYVPTIQLASAHGGIFGVITALIAIYTAAILIDQPRKWMWRKLSARIFR